MLGVDQPLRQHAGEQGLIEGAHHPRLPPGKDRIAGRIAEQINRAAAAITLKGY
ncbi:MAG TPA: hypothetical protein VFX60_12605 [Micromonospora sp.]|nr:hypothetical protein [Micromonospora sp.]